MFGFEDMPEIKEELLKVNNHIERLCESNSESMQKMMDWVLQSRGKQIRPTMTLLCSKLKNKKVDATEIAAVIEICHTASLIHDDIIDDSEERRGQLSVQKKFGREMAVYAGDFMIFATLGRTDLRLKPWFRDMFDKLEYMCDGEVSQFDNRFNNDITEEKCIQNIIGKTSAMFEIACEAGAYEGKCNKEEREAVCKFARHFGVLFQLRDDLMDFIASSDEMEKTTQNDFWTGYYTLPAIYTFENNNYGEKLRLLAKEVKNAKNDIVLNNEILDLIKEAGGFEHTIEKIRENKDMAIESLNCFEDTKAKRKLIEVVNYLWESTIKAC